MVLRRYEVITGFFSQDDSNTNGYAYDTPRRFGLIDTSNQRWPNTIEKIKDLNANAEQGVSYKLIIAGRHGQGYHNLGYKKYGRETWLRDWVKLDGDGEITWGPDPLLTPLGEEQARDACLIWKEEREAGIPIPDGIYCSPMTRALQTCKLTFSGVLDLAQKRPLILENAREIYGMHSCDQRRTRSYIHSTFPEFDIEDGFSEEDSLHESGVRESYSHVAERAHKVLDYVFENNGGIVISIIAHSRFIRSLCGTIGHYYSTLNDEEWSSALQTGRALPIVLKSTISTS